MKTKIIISIPVTIGIISIFYLNQSVLGCTNFLITKGATTDGSTMITYAADAHVLYGELYFRPAKDYPEGSYFDIYEWDTGKFLGKIKQVRHTYSVVGNINEFQVAIGETTYGGRKELRDTTAQIDYGNLMYVTLQRAKTAREAIKIIGELVAEYGYNSEGESFSISDPNEVWILEIIGKGVGNKGAVWVARRIPDGYISAHANQARIRQFPLENKKTSISSKNIDKIFLPTIECVYATDVISFAREKGYFKGKKDEEFSFADAYAPLDYGALRFCEARVWSMFRRAAPSLNLSIDYVKNADEVKHLPLWIKPDKKLSVQDVMAFMRDHFEDSEFYLGTGVGAGPFYLPYRWRPMTWEVDGVKYLHERSASTQQTGFSFVAQSRGWLPNKIGGILWFGVDDTYTTVYVPMYCGISKVPETYAEGNGSMIEFTWNSAFWVFNFVSNFAYLRYCDMVKDIQKVQQELENRFVSEVPEIDKKALTVYKTDSLQAIQIITDYSVSRGNMTVQRWLKLGEYLLTKYIDGNIKKEKDGKFETNGFSDKIPAPPHQPGYPEWWRRLIVEKDGEKIKMKKLKGEESSH